MEVLIELKALENKEISVVLVNLNSHLINTPKKISQFIESQKIDFSTIDFENINSENSLNESFDGLPCLIFPVKMPQHVKDRFFVEIVELDEDINVLLDKFEKLRDKKSYRVQNMRCWIDLLLKKVKDKKKVWERKVKPLWIAKYILDIAKGFNGKKVRLAHFVKSEYIPELKKVLEDLNVNVMDYEIEYKRIIYDLHNHYEVINSYGY